jgi:hypothetical protein
MSNKFDNVIKKFLINEFTTTTSVPVNLGNDIEKQLKNLPQADKNALGKTSGAIADAVSNDPTDQTHGLLKELVHPTDGSKTYQELVSNNQDSKAALDARIKELGLQPINTQKTPQTTPIPNTQQGGSAPTSSGGQAPQTQSTGTSNIYGTN